jgi:hypothetical protein
MKQTQNLPEYITATIKDWQHLLATEPFKMIIIEQLKAMIDENLLEVYGFLHYVKSHSFYLAFE